MFDTFKNCLRKLHNNDYVIIIRNNKVIFSKAWSCVYDFEKVCYLADNQVRILQVPLIRVNYGKKIFVIEVVK